MDLFVKGGFPSSLRWRAYPLVKVAGFGFDDGVGQGMSSTRFLVGGTLKGNPAKLWKNPLKTLWKKIEDVHWNTKYQPRISTAKWGKHWGNPSDA